MSNENPSSVDVSGDVTAKAVSKRYECLVAIRTKGVKGKGAWYWAYLEPILIRNPDTNVPKAVKLKCNLCDAAFSASNPSRTASEHLKCGICPNFSSILKPGPQLPPLPSQQNHRKRSSQPHRDVGTSSHAYPVDMIDSCRFSYETGINPAQCVHSPLVLSGGKEDLGPLAQLESSVKKLKSPKASPSPVLSKEQANNALDLLADWFCESCGEVSFMTFEHPKFKAFLSQVGLPAVLKREFLRARLDSKFEEASMEAEARIKDAAFFQVASDGWRCKDFTNANQCFVMFMVNLPNGTIVFRKVVFSACGIMSSEHAEEVFWETIQGICSNEPQRCVGIIADKYKSKALRNLELQNHWMVNLSCQVQGFFSLIKDFCRELPLFKIVSDSCIKIANLINTHSQVRNSLHKFRLQGYEVPNYIRVPPSNSHVSTNVSSFLSMLGDLMSCSRILHLIVVDDSYKVLCLTDLSVREVTDAIQDVGFWNDVEVVHSLVKMILEMADDIEAERPLLAQCLPLWEELKARVKDWCAKYNFSEGPMQNIVEKRFRKVYHPAWSAAFILDPLYLVRDSSGKYLPPFTCLSHEQEKDVDEIITRLASREEAHIALMELMKWRSEGLDPLYAQAVQVKQRDPVTGKMRAANPQSSRLVWETCLKELKSLGKVAVRLLFLHATSSGIKCDSSFTRWFCAQGCSRPSLEIAQKLFSVAAHAKVKRRDLSSAEEKEAELLGPMVTEDDMLNEVLADA